MIKDCDLFLQYVADNLKYLKHHLQSWAFNQHIKFDEDIFSDTIVKIYNLLEKQGYAQDNTPKGFENLIFRAFTTNTFRESQYARNRCRDLNIYDGTNLFDIYEAYKSNETTVDDKVESDLYKDFIVHYILIAVENNFDTISYCLFKQKLFTGYTYKKIIEITNIKDAKKRITEINKWLKENINIKDINKSFDIYKNSL